MRDSGSVHFPNPVSHSLPPQGIAHQAEMQFATIAIATIAIATASSRPPRIAPHQTHRAFTPAATP